jgi:hypothetical protein
MFRELGMFEYHPSQWERFKSGELRQYWAETYPQIFDARDIEIACHQAPAPMNNHFFEWLAAVLIYQSFGYLSLIEQYEFKRHKRKQSILREVLTSEAFKLVTDHAGEFGGVQSPDLFVYSRDRLDWFFCEVKGPRDRLREVQVKYFSALSMVTKKAIRTVRFKPAVPFNSA